MKNLGYYNGKYDLIENMTVPMNDRACYFGDGLYEAVYTRNYIMYALDEHMDRLYDSAEKSELISLTQKRNSLLSLRIWSARWTATSFWCIFRYQGERR